MRKMTCEDPNVDLVNMNAYIKFGEIRIVTESDYSPAAALSYMKRPSSKDI